MVITKKLEDLQKKMDVFQTHILCGNMEEAEKSYHTVAGALYSTLVQAKTYHTKE